MTTNGKIDRRALPAPVESRSELLGAYVARRNEVERALARIWAQVLGVVVYMIILTSAAIHVEFAHCGAGSGRCVGVAARLFTQQTIAELAGRTDGCDRGSGCGRAVCAHC
ncbi:MAG: hypothetical protein R3E31_16655 [Chloroflexota bacterium]